MNVKCPKCGSEKVKFFHVNIFNSIEKLCFCSECLTTFRVREGNNVKMGKLDIVDNRKIKNVQFDNYNVGGMFIYEGGLYIKIKEVQMVGDVTNALSLPDCSLMCFRGDAEVSAVDARIRIY